MHWTVTARWLLCSLLMVLAVPAIARDAVFVVEPTGHEELDRALLDGLNLPTLYAAGVMGEPGSDQWTANIGIELGRLTELVRSFGYLTGRVELMDKAGDAQGAPTPASIVRLLPVPGPVFRIGVVQVSGLDGSSFDRLAAGIDQRARQSVGAIADGRQIESLTGGIVRTVLSGSFPHARLSGWQLVPDPDTRTASLHLTIDTGPMLRMGPISFKGADPTSQETLKALAPFSAGDPYDPGVIEAYRTALDAVPNLRRARVEIDDQIDAGMANVIVSVAEAPDPARLAYLEVRGIAALGLLLAVLAARQITIAAGPRNQASVVHGFDIAVLVLMAVGIALALRRILALTFAS